MCLVQSKNINRRFPVQTHLDKLGVCEREKYKDIKINIKMYARVSVSTLVLVTHNTSHTHSVPQEVNSDTP